ncbi:GIY-YIG nuclease family protein [Brachybacterium sacelli]|uniref:GIY-YIG nuclease family protein n=1 Tax=Brachybacterium sacelli TaxID=173364 RepID=UPI001AE2C502
MPGSPGLGSAARKLFRIYALLTPDRLTAHYVGQTADALHRRLEDHLRRPGHSKKADWIRAVRESGDAPQIVLLEEFTGYRQQAYERETYWIRRLRAQGHPLKNVP